MKNIIQFFSGKKTYGLAILTIIYAVAGMITGFIDPKAAIDLILAGLGTMTMRAAVAKTAV